MLKLGSFDNQQSPIYFNRTDVQDAIHAPRISWNECSSIVSTLNRSTGLSLISDKNVYVNGTDNSVPVMLSVMPNVIEKSERTVVMHGGIVSPLSRQSTKSPC